MDLSIIIVSYNQPDYLAKCIESIYSNTEGISFEVIIVDNQSPDKRVAGLLEENSFRRKGFKYIINSENIGFAAANNIGFMSSVGDYVVFLNPDTVLLNSSFNILIDFLKSHPGSAVCGPRILYPDGSFQVSFYSLPSLAKKFFKVMGLNKIMARKPGLLKKLFRFRKLMPGYMSMFYANFENIDDNMEVPWVTGACLMVKSGYFQQVGLFDENYRMYCEDMDLCLRMQKKGLKVFFIPAARIIHHRGWMNRSKQSLDFYFDSHSYYYKKNFRGIYKSMLLFLNSLERTYERLFLYLRTRFSRT